MLFEEDGHSVDGKESAGGKPIVLLLGDSIRMGYCEATAKALADIADVVYPSLNCRSSQHMLVELRSWASLCEQGDVVMVHFNCGHWDIAHWNSDEESLTSPREYEKNLKAIIRRLRKLYPQAILVWASTSCMNPNGAQGVNPRSNNEIEQYNRIAEKVMANEDIPIHDIYGYTRQLDESDFADYCHLTASSFSNLGIETADYLRKHMK